MQVSSQYACVVPNLYVNFPSHSCTSLLVMHHAIEVYTTQLELTSYKQMECLITLGRVLANENSR